MSHHATYDSTQNDIGAYNDYDSQVASQESFYANNYGGAAPTQFPPAPPNGYYQGYAKIEGALELETETGYCKGFFSIKSHLNRELRHAEMAFRFELQLSPAGADL